jgi:hypothetical protein
MNRNIKYKQVCRLVLNCNDDLLKSSTNSQYSCTNNAIVNSKIIRFSLNNSLSDVILSQNAKCVLESCHIPNITNLTNQIVYLRLVTSSQNKTYDTTKGLNGNPIILSTMIHSSTVQSNVITNNSDMFYSINIPSNFLQKGLIDMELECPSATSSINYVTGLPLKTFYISLIIIDEDLELTKDLTLAPPIDYNNYNVNMPIRNY